MKSQYRCGHFFADEEVNEDGEDTEGDEG